MHPMLYTATKAAREAGDIIRRAAGKTDQIRISEKSPSDFVSEVDRQSEKTIVHLLRRAYPEHGIVGEEFGQQGADNPDQEWIIDPLDGTTNYLHGLSYCAISIAFRQQGRIMIGVIYDPFKDELFCAARGEGATLNNRRIRVNARTSINSALLSTGIPFSADRDLDQYLATLRVLLPDTAGVRRTGSAALDLAYVACGRMDGFWEFGLHSWDIAAGALLIQEAGGLVGDLQGGNTHLDTGNILAASPKVFKEMLRRLHPIVTR